MESRARGFFPPRCQLPALAGSLSGSGAVRGSDAIAAGLRGPPQSEVRICTEINLSVDISSYGKDSFFL